MTRRLVTEDRYSQGRILLQNAFVEDRNLLSPTQALA